MPPFDIQERTFQFSLKIIQLYKGLSRSIVSDVIGKQLLRAATSIGANVAEAQGSVSRKEFLQYLQIARKSNYETLYWLRLLQRQSGQSAALQEFIAEATELKSILTSIILTSKRNGTKQPHNS